MNPHPALTRKRLDHPQVILVTGASSGIGLETVRSLLAMGHRVYAAARNLPAMEPLREAGARILHLDLTDPDSAEGVVSRILESEGGLDVLVNNAGYGSYGSVEEMPMDLARKQMEVNLFGLARLCQLAIPLMRGQGFGTIVNVSSVGGRIYTPLGAWYHASKFAVEGFSDALRFEVAHFGIRVCVVQPGPIRTQWDAVAGKSMEQVSGQGPYARLVQQSRALFGQSYAMASGPEAVARAIVRLIHQKRPPTRVAVGRGASTMLVLRAMLPDRIYDGITRMLMGSLA